jgi:hypothetical protein
MSLRFGRSTSFLGGLLRLNFSKSGVSLSAGVPGATVNVGRKGVVATAGLPGSGVSFRQRVARFGSRRPINIGDE